MGGRLGSLRGLMIKLVWPLKQLMWNRLFLASQVQMTGHHRKRTKEQLSQEHHSSPRAHVLWRRGNKRQQTQSREVYVQHQKLISDSDRKRVPVCALFSRLHIALFPIHILIRETTCPITMSSLFCCSLPCKLKWKQDNCLMDKI